MVELMPLFCVKRECDQTLGALARLGGRDGRGEGGEARDRVGSGGRAASERRQAEEGGGGLTGRRRWWWGCGGEPFGRRLLMLR